jgi:hypothetical protein
MDFSFINERKIFLSVCFLMIAFCSVAQNVNLDSLLDAELDKKNKDQTQYTEGTFKTSRLINSHTVETTQKGVLDLKISHRFSSTENGIYDLFGFDNAIAMRLGADYGLTNRLTIGAGRNAYQKEYDGFLKYRLLWQSTGKKNIPVSVTLLASGMYQTSKDGKVVKDTSGKNEIVDLSSNDRVSGAFQILIARKFNSAFSLQLMPTLVNTVDTTFKHYNLFSIGFGTRLKLTKRSAITAEYFLQLPDHALQTQGADFKTWNSFSLGYEMETGGHVFQVSIGNSVGISERTFITKTYEPWCWNNLHLGFNISRVFTIKKPKSLSQETQPTQKWTPAVDSMAIKKSDSTVQYTQATFKTTRLINGHTVETTQKGVLDFRITHRFGAINTHLSNFFGLDQASMRIGLDYGITNRFTIGAGRSAGGAVDPTEKEYDGFLKYRLLWQSTGEKNMPVSLTAFSSVLINALRGKKTDSTKESGLVEPQPIHRFSYAYQLIIARKFSNAFSLQLSPTLIHYNLVDSSSTHNNLVSIGIGTRIKLTPRSSLNIEYYPQFSNISDIYKNSFSIGYEIETGGHVFQFHLTNSTSMAESTFITETKDSWGKGEIHMGFNISRVFTIKKPKNIPQ